jgi:hypothetical protein
MAIRGIACPSLAFDSKSEDDEIISPVGSPIVGFSVPKGTKPFEDRSFLLRLIESMAAIPSGLDLLAEPTSSVVLPKATITSIFEPMTEVTEKVKTIYSELIVTPKVEDKIRLYMELFAFYSADWSAHEKSCLKEVKISCFSTLPPDYTEDVKYRVWKNSGSIDTLGSDLGQEIFAKDPHAEVVAEAVLSAGKVPRISRYYGESLFMQLESLVEGIEKQRKDASSSLNFTVFQAYEIAQKLFSRSPETASGHWLTTFFPELKEDTVDLIIRKMLEIDSSLDSTSAEKILTEEPFHSLSARAIRAVKNRYIDEFLTA